MLTELIRSFCQENNFKVYEGCSGRMMFGKKTIGIILKPDQNLFDVFAQLTRYLESKDFEDPFMELGGVSIDDLGLDALIYFPNIRDYQPPQP